MKINSKEALIKNKVEASMMRHNYFKKPDKISEKVSILDRLKAAYLVFTCKAYAQMWYSEEEIDEKVKRSILYYKEKTLGINCSTSDCECYDALSKRKCSIENLKAIKMCRIYVPERIV